MTIPMKKTVKKATEADIGKYVYATDSVIVPPVESAEREIASKYRKLVAVISEEYNISEPFITAKNSGSATPWGFAYVINEVPIPYTEGQEASGLKTGDWVKVTRKATKGEGGWGNTWTDEMDKYVGSIARVGDIYSTMGISLPGCGYKKFPYFVLEKVTTRPANEEDAGKKCLYHASECTIDAIFKGASDGKLWAALKSASGSMCVAELTDIQVFLDQPQVQAPQPDWMPKGWRQLRPDEVIRTDDLVQNNSHPQPPKSADTKDPMAWTGAYRLGCISAQVGKMVKESNYPKDIWIRKVE